jgi:pilus assembly protein Flp/PilA
MFTQAKIHRFLESEDGPTAVEYAVMLALIIVACVTIIRNLGSVMLSSTYGTISSTLAGS